MRRRGGFTLVEVMVGVVITGVVALLVYGAIRTAADTQARLADGRTAVRGEMAWRALVADAVRGIRSGRDYEEPTFILQDDVDADGRPADRLVVVTAGSTPPLAPGTDWRVSLGVGPGGLVAEATPAGWRGGVPRTVWGPEEITGLDVQALASGATGWVDGWTPGGVLPHAVRITFWTADGPAGVALVLAVPLGGAP
jgi:prepilin-type N-terminal cleavage/methylation domain-containing protein